MKKITLLCLLWLVSATKLFTQANKTDLDKIPTETVNIHVNTKLVFAGEYLYYKFYCMLSESKALSSLSKVGYVDLINQEKEVVFQHKLILENGRAFSEFFIPANLPSGNYKLIGYTNWMRNFGASTFFKKDITVLNPYLGNQNVFLGEDLTENENLPKKSKLPKKSNSNKNGTIRLKTDKEVYDKRDKVKLEVTSHVGHTLDGIYSLSVRKKTMFEDSLEKKALLITSNSDLKNKPNSYPFLPESRGAFLSGKIKLNNNAVQKLMISYPGENNLFHIATTDDKGNFTIPISATYYYENMYIRPFSNTKVLEKIILDNNQNMEYGNLHFNSFKLNESMKRLILKRSIHNQIENAFFENKPDSLVPPKPLTPFYNGHTEEFILDDYTRFSTLKETIVEILKLVSLNNDINGTTYFKVIPTLPLLDSGETSLVFLDGAYIHNHESLLTLPSKSIEKITITRDQFLYGSHSFQGILDIRTFEKNAYLTYLDSETQGFPHKQYRNVKKYYKEDYSGSKKELKKHLPDFRNQLAWIPEIKGTKSFFYTSFYTSDVSGEFEITLQGFNRKGLPVKLTESITVN